MMENIVREGPPLDEAQRVIIVIHGMSTTVETLRQGYPATPESGLTKLYWRLPVLREGADSVRRRRSDDAFDQLFTPVVDESRAELTHLLTQFEGPVGLFGFSIGGLIALLGALDNTQVGAVVTMGGVPGLNYLQHYLPDYNWADETVKARLQSYNLLPRAQDLAAIPILLCHGEQDEVARWEWMGPFADALTMVNPASQVKHFAHLHHRLAGHSREELVDLEQLRSLADDWFRHHLPVYRPSTGA